MSNIEFRIGENQNLDLEQEFFEDNLELDFEINTNTGKIQKTDQNLRGDLAREWDQLFWQNIPDETAWNGEGFEGSYLQRDAIFGHAANQGTNCLSI